MPYGLLTFDQLPRVGFAHHFYTEQYRQCHQVLSNSLEIAYVKEGDFTAEFGGGVYAVQPGSVLVLVRTRPFRTYAPPGTPQAHCSVQLVFDFACEFMDNSTDIPPDYPGLILPLVVPPGPEAEQIRKELYAIVAEVNARRDTPPLSASVAGLTLLMQLDRQFRQTRFREQTGSLLEYKVKRYVAEHIHREMTLEEIGEALNRTPNYLNSVFKAATGLSIRRYINRERVYRIAELMEQKGLPFKTACENVAIDDVAYGYRLFKQYMGVTTRAYFETRRNREETLL